MNNYNDYYNYLNSGYSDMNFMPNPNKMINDMNNQNTINQPFTGTSQNKPLMVEDTMTGFKKGNMFKDLYDPYKNYKPEELKASSEREDLLMQIDEQRFAMIDLGLYLDLYPNDKNILNLYNTTLNKEQKLCDLFESKYGPLTLNSPVQTNNWLWNNSPWPWEVQN